MCLKTTSDIDDAINILTRNIQSPVWDSAKGLPSSINLPIFIRAFISQKRRARNYQIPA